MNIHDMIEILLKKGMLLKLIYINEHGIKKYSYVMLGEWFNFLNIQEKIDDSIVYDICTNKEFDITKYSIEVIEYVIFPKNVLLEDLLDPSDAVKTLGFDFLKHNEDYIDDLKKIVLNLKVSLQQIYDIYLGEMKNLTDQDIDDFYFLRFYPNKVKNRVTVLEDLKNDIDEKYFVCDDQTSYTNEFMSTIPALIRLGIFDKNIDLQDEEFINAIKRRWYSFIVKEKDEIYEKLKNIDMSAFTSDEKIEYSEELNLFRRELDLIDIHVLDNLKTVKDVIRYWPDLLQPKPNFVYED